MAVTPAYTLQILSFYGESGLLGVKTAPIMGALIDKFDDMYANTLVLGEGDSYIPGPWLVGGADPSLNAVAGIGATALGRPDIAIMNAFGTDATSLGNHEFDLGSPVLQGAITASGAWVGAQFPLITTNVSFTADSSLRGLADASLGGTGTNAFAGAEASTLKGKIAPYAVVTQGGEKIGIVGATTYDLLSKTSPNGAVPKDDANVLTSDLQEVAAYLQAAIDSLKAAGVNKIVMVDQLDTIQRNMDLAGLVNGIDVMVAGGGHERLGDATDTAVAFNGHDATFVDTFPIQTVGADGKPLLIITTDTEYTYLGRLVVDFDANGDVITGNLDPAINGAYASTEATLQAAYGSTATAAEIIATSTIGTKVQAISNAINTVVAAKDGNVFGYTNVYLEGDRVYGRSEETNLGDISADANIEAAAHALGNGQPYIVSLKNGGGLRASVGSVDENGAKIAPLASDVKAVGGISQLDIENALRFDNKMMVCDTTAQGLLNIFNYAAGLAAGNGGFPQVGGLRFSYDPDNAAGAKIVNMSLTDIDGNITARLVENGVVVVGAPALISIVVLNFTANGGDGYPIKANADNFRYLLSDGTLSAPVSEALDFTAVANVPANAVGEQKTFQDYLQAHYATPETAYNTADTVAALDIRIENLNRTAGDSVFTGAKLNGDAGDNTLTGTAGDDTVFAGDGHDTVVGGDGSDVLVGNNDPFAAALDSLDGGAGNDTVYAKSGDTVVGGAGRDVLYQVNDVAWNIDLGGTGFEYIRAGFNGDTINAASQTSGVEIYAGGGDDTVTGSALADVLWGENGNDTLIGSGGDDVLIGGLGADNLFGGAGNDRVFADASDTNVDGGTGTDALYITAGAGMVVDLAGARFEYVADLAGGNDNLDGSGLTVSLEAYASGGNDVVTGGAGADFLWGEAGNDMLSGNGGADVLVGGAGGDTLSGGLGNDTVYASGGAGGDGVLDTIVFDAPGFGNDIVYDFEIGLDKLDVRGTGATALTVSITDDAGNAHVQIGSDLIVVVGAGATLTTADFTF